MRRSTVLNLSLQLVFPALGLGAFSGEKVGKNAAENLTVKLNV
jgi:hypothetical protein